MQPNRQVPISDQISSSRGHRLCFILFWVILTIVVFRDVLLPGKILMTTDDNIGALMLLKSQLPRAFVGGWNDSVLCGVAQLAMVNWTNCLLWLLPINVVTDWLHGLDLLIASVFFGCFVRTRIKNWAICILASLVAFWVGSNFTLTYAGHIGKFGVLVFAAASLLLIEKAVRTGRSAFAILAGGAMGAMFLEQADVALFFALFLGPYAIYAFVRDRGVSYRRFARFLAPFIIVGALVALRPLWEGYRISVQNITVAGEDDPKAKWAFATQWSWPPEESIDFVAPGFMGWRSGEPAGPYYGRMGRSEGWEETKQGFRNFKLENQYLGAIPIAFALFSIFIAVLSVAGRDSRNELHAVINRAWRQDVFFWGTVFFISLFLSFGKYFPLYRVFYQFPVVSAIRNPNKFLQVFQVAAAILAAYGMDAAVRLGRSVAFDGYTRQKIRSYVYGVLAVGALMTIWALTSTLSWNELVQRFAADEFAHYADTIVKNRLWGLLHGSLMVFAAAAGISMMTLWKARPSSVVRVAPWIFAALVLADVLFLSRHYVKTMPISEIAENDVTRLLKSDMPERRVALTAQDGFYNFWLTYTFPYYGIKTINVTQMPRMPGDYQNFLGALNRSPIRLWQLCATGYILGPSGIWGQVSQEPSLKDCFDLVLAYNVISSNGIATIVRGIPSQPGQHCVLRLTKVSPAFALFAGWQIVKDEEALRLLASDDFPLFERALLSADSAGGLPEPVEEGIVGSVQLVDYRPGLIKLRASTHVPAILRIAEKYDKGWKVNVNGRPALLRRVDYLFQGVCVNPGVNEVVFRYAPDNRSLMLQAAGIAICGAAFVWLVRGKLRNLA